MYAPPPPASLSSAQIKARLEARIAARKAESEESSLASGKKDVDSESASIRSGPSISGVSTAKSFGGESGISRFTDRKERKREEKERERREKEEKKRQELLRKEEEELRKRQEELKRKQDEFNRRQIEERKKQEEYDRKQEEERRKRIEAAKKQEAEKKAFEAARKRQEELNLQEEAEKRKREELHRQRSAERRRLEELQREQEAERRERNRQLEAERKKQEELNRKQEAERKKQEEYRRKQEAERQREDEANRKREAERKKQEEESARKREAERKRQEEEANRQPIMRSFFGGRKEKEDRHKSLTSTSPPHSPNPTPSVSSNNVPLSPSSVRSSEGRDGRSAMEIRLEKRMQAEKQAKEIRQQAMAAGFESAAPPGERRESTVPRVADPPAARATEQPLPMRPKQEPRYTNDLAASPPQHFRQTSAVASRFDAPASSRKAPSRPPRPSHAQLPPLPPLSSPKGSLPPVPQSRSTPPPDSAPPPVPDKSPRRQKSTKRSTDESQGIWSQPTENSLIQAIAQLELDNQNRPATAPRSSTMPNFVNDRLIPTNAKASLERSRSGGQAAKKPRPRSVASTASNTSTASSSKVSKGGGVASAATAKRGSATAAIKAALQDIGTVPTPPLRPPRRATDGDLRSGGNALSHNTSPNSSSREASPVRLPWKRRRKGETMSMLLDTGFFPPPDEQEELELKLSVNLRKAMPPSPIRIQTDQVFKVMSDRELPDTPGSIAPTPTELYAGVQKALPKRMIRARGAKLNRRSPLGQIASTSAQANANEVLAAEAARLSAIPENTLSAFASRENTPPISGVSTPQPTQIHLRNGSVVTISTPEMTAWQRNVYLQGPIRLEKPAVVPRKDSIASLEPFQDAVDQIYQSTLNIPRRRSDDATIDDVCEFFDEFGFEDIGFGGDFLGMEDIQEHEKDVDVEEMDIDGPERFATPPMEPEPVEKAIARTFVEAAPKPVPKPPIPPIVPPIAPADSQELLRAKGIARLSQMSGRTGDSASTRSRRDSVQSSMTVASERSFNSIAPAEASVLEIVEEAPAYEERRDQGFDWDDGVQEVDGSSAWVAPGLLPRNALNGKQTRNPVKKMRRFVATASTLL